jgi:hypothetical protein
MIDVCDDMKIGIDVKDARTGLYAIFYKCVCFGKTLFYIYHR